MWLDPLERRIFDKLIGMGRYVVLAPYARQGERNCRPFCGKTGCFAEEKYVPLAECLCKLGWHVIIIGAQENGFPLPEVASCAGRCILNWVNNTSIRLAVEVIRNADGFIGPQSGPLAAAWSNKVPSVFFFPEGVHDRNWEILTGRFNGDWSWYTGVYCKDEPWVAWFMETPEGFAGLAPETVAMKLEEVMKRRVPL
jgi:ADP-heptose:LPS heptosyltransferase